METSNELQALRDLVDQSTHDPDYTIVMCHDWLARFLGLPGRAWTHNPETHEVTWDDTPENREISKQIRERMDQEDPGWVC